MEDFKIGNVGFNAKALKGITLGHAYAMYSFLRKELVRMAHEKVNPPKKTKK
jgi:L-asparagine transporter-like permease